MDLRVSFLDHNSCHDIIRMHSEESEMSGYYCASWLRPNPGGRKVQSWESRPIPRVAVNDKAIYCGYILYVDDWPFGWCQCGPRDRLPQVARMYNLIPDPEIWAITCIYVAPELREIGLAHYLMTEIMKDLAAKSIRYIQGFPRRGSNLAAAEVWTGPEAIFKKAGFGLERDNPYYPVYGKELTVQEG